MSPAPVVPTRPSAPPASGVAAPGDASLPSPGPTSPRPWRAGEPVAAADVAGAWRLTPRTAGHGAGDVLLLLAGGLARRSLVDSPLSLTLPDADPATWPSDSPWTLWRAGADGAPELLTDTRGGEWRAVEGHRIDTAAKPAGAARGAYERTDAQRWGTSTFVRTNVLVLDAAGRFARWSRSLSTYESVLTSMPGARLGGWTRGPVDEGRYALLEDGLTIELTRADGTVVRELFHADDDGVHLHGHALSRRGDPPDVDALLARMEDPEHRVHVGSRDWLAVAGHAHAEEAEDDARRERQDPATRRATVDATTFGEEPA